jgi:hypothetical protein
MPRNPSPTQIRRLRDNLIEFHNLYLRYLELTYPPRGNPPPAASELRAELTQRVGVAQQALDLSGVQLARLPAPAFGGPILRGLPNLLFIHERDPVPVFRMQPFCQNVIEALQVAVGYLARRERDEAHRRRSPVYWLDWVITGFLGIPAYIVSRIIGVPVWKIEDSPVGFGLRLVGLAIDGLVAYFGGRELGWW